MRAARKSCWREGGGGSGPRADTPQITRGPVSGSASDEPERQNRASSASRTKNFRPRNDAQKDWDGSEAKGDIRRRGALCLAPAPEGQHTFSWCLKLAGDGQGPRGADLCWSPPPPEGPQPNVHPTRGPPESEPRPGLGARPRLRTVALGAGSEDVLAHRPASTTARTGWKTRPAHRPGQGGPPASASPFSCYSVRQKRVPGLLATGGATGAQPSPGSPHRSLGGAGRKVCRQADLPHCRSRPGRGHPAPNTQIPVTLHAALPRSEGSQEEEDK